MKPLAIVIVLAVILLTLNGCAVYGPPYFYPGYYGYAPYGVYGYGYPLYGYYGISPRFYGGGFLEEVMSEDIVTMAMVWV
jgi:hypothetical protein